MEVCGADPRRSCAHGLDRLLPDGLELITDAGCPSASPPARAIDPALELSHQPGVILCSYGEHAAGAGSAGRSRWNSRAEAANVRVVASPRCACHSPRDHQAAVWLFFAVGFETNSAGHRLAAHIRPAAVGAYQLGLCLWCMCGSPPANWKALPGTSPEGRRAGPSWRWPMGGVGGGGGGGLWR